MRVVLTGGPCCGKTTMIEALGERGYSVLEESARKVILQNPGVHPKKLAHEILSHQLEVEKKFYKGFMDRSVIDSFAYAEFFGIKLPEINPNNYGKIFILERLPLEKDGVRFESEEEAEKIHDIIRKTYAKFGYDPVIVPVSTIDERVEFILKNMKGGDE